MGCSNTKSDAATRQYSISFDSEYPSTDGSGQGQHPSHDTDHLIFSPNKLELIIDSDPTSPASLHSPRPRRPSNSTSPPWHSNSNGPEASSSAASDLMSPLYDQQKILLSKHHYVIESLLQEGAIGKVYCGRNKLTGREYALKFFGYTNIDPEERDIEHEIQVMNSFKGISGIVQMIGFFYDSPQGLIPGKIFCNPYPVIVMELLTGGEVFETIHHNSHISEYILSKIFYSMTLSVQSIHQKHYIHRDIKLENMMFTSPAATTSTFVTSTSFTSISSSNGSAGGSPLKTSQGIVGIATGSASGSALRSASAPGVAVAEVSGGAGTTSGGGAVGGAAIKIIDFGLMVKVTSPDGIYHDDDVVGTPGYLAPESYDYYDYSYASDIWSLGCCLYSMLSGLLPFNPNTNQQNVHHRYRPMTGPAWVNISKEAKDLVKQLLQRSSHARYSIEQILSHPWLIDSAPDLSPPSVAASVTSPGSVSTTTATGGMSPMKATTGGEGDTAAAAASGSHRHEHLGDEYLSRIKYLSLKQKMKSFFLNSNQILDNNQRTRDQLQRIIPLLRKESSSILSRSSSGSSLTMTPSPLSKQHSGGGFLLSHHHQLSNSTLASSSTTHSPMKPTPPSLKGTQKYKSTPPGGPAGGGAGQSSPYIKERFLGSSKPPIGPQVPHLPLSYRNTPPQVGSGGTPRSPSLRSSHSLDFLGRVSSATPNSPVKPLRQMSENELQTRLQSFKRSVLSSLLRSTSSRSMSSGDIASAMRGDGGGGGVGAGAHGGSHGIGPNRYTINKETFLCLMLDAGLPELASSRVFHIFDTDHNGVLDLKEFLLTMLAFQSRSPRQQRRGGGGENSQRTSQRHRRKFYRSKDQRRSTLDEIDELKTDVSEVRGVAVAPRPRPMSTPSGSRVFRDIMNAATVPADASDTLTPSPYRSGGLIGSQLSGALSVGAIEMSTLDEDLESDFATSNSSPEKITGFGSGPRTRGETEMRGSGSGPGSGRESSGGGGAVDEEELLARLYFDIFDLDGNGSIDKDELRVAVNAFFLDEITTGTVGLTPTSSSYHFPGHGNGHDSTKTSSTAFPFLSPCPSPSEGEGGESGGAGKGNGGGEESSSSYSSKCQSNHSSSNSLIGSSTSPNGTQQPYQPSIQKADESMSRNQKKEMNQSQQSLYSSPAEATRDIEELFATIDCNHTGKITFNEFLPFFKKIRRSGSEISEDQDS
jgi:serine/threonine protein kinase/Ca2+-binding EF-hand superfamily protein